MRFHEIAGELKTYMDPTGHGSDFVIALVGYTLRAPMNKEEKKMDVDDTFNPLASDLSINMLDQILEGKKFISKYRASLICRRYDGRDLVDKIDNLCNTNKEHLQIFLEHRGIVVDIKELGSAIRDILMQIFLGLAQGIHDVDIKLTIHNPKPSIKNLAGDRIYCEGGKLYIDGDVIELPIKLSDAQIYAFEARYISALCDAYAEALSRDSVTVDDIPTLEDKYQTNFYDQHKAYISAEIIQRSISEVYEDGKNQFDILKADAYDGIRTTYLDDYDNGYRRLVEVLKKITDVQLTKSKLSLIKNLIGNLERRGIVHILVNDRTITSWVDPYAK